MDEAIQPDAPDDGFVEANGGKVDRTAKERQRAWRRANPADARAAVMKWRAANPVKYREGMRARMKAWRAKKKAEDLTGDDV